VLQSLELGGLKRAGPLGSQLPCGQPEIALEIFDNQRLLNDCVPTLSCISYSEDMTEPRRSTVYDYSELRLHPDGTRVYQKPTNLRPAIAKVSVQNARSTWIARDAGGPGSVPKFRKKRGKVESTENEPEGEKFKDADRQSSGDDGGPESLNLKRKPKRTDHRKAKKQKFIADYEYLNASTMASTSSAFDLDEPQEDESTLNEVPEPSPVRFHSNYLKVILHCCIVRIYSRSSIALPLSSTRKEANS